MSRPAQRPDTVRCRRRHPPRSSQGRETAPGEGGAHTYTWHVERKLATAMFVDLVDSTALVSSSDPEVARRRVTGFFDRVKGHIDTYGGTVEKFAGDAVLAVFGVPTAHEDDAERAVRAALAIVESGDGELPVRIGIEAGELVVEDGDSTFATGEAINMAARLQQNAEPGEILVGPTARGLAPGVVTESVGERPLKGFAVGLEVRRVVCAERPTGRPLSIAAPYVGREEELALLENAYSRAVRDRRAQLVTIFGDPGIGKSRLAREFFAGLERTTVLTGRCLPFGEGLTYRPLAEMVQATAGISPDDSPEEAFEKLKEACTSDAVADLLGLASGVLDTVSGGRRGQEIAWAAHEWVGTLAEAQPLVLGFEDVHWADEPLLDLIEHLADRVQDAPRPDRLPFAPRAAGVPTVVGWRPAAVDRDRAWAAAGGREPTAHRCAVRRCLAARRPPRRRSSRRPRAIRCSSRRRCGCSSSRATAPPRAFPTRCRR